MNHQLVLDTNVISELMRPEPEPRVLAWAEGLSDDAAITSITMGELLLGVALLPVGRRRSLINARVADAISTFADRVLPYDRAAATAYVDVIVARRRAGHPISVADAQIAAICVATRSSLATRNVADFEGLGLEIRDPWVPA